jgi:hypothetical protein
MRVLRSSLFVAATAIIAAACGDKVNIVQPTSTVGGIQSVQVAPSTATISVGGTVQLTASVNTDPGVTATVAWTTSSAAAATVSSSGLVTGVAASPGVAICATATAGTSTKNNCATVVVSAASQPIPATVQIASVTGAGGLNIPVPVPPGVVAGQINVSVNVNPGTSKIDSVVVFINGISAGTQTFTSGQAAAMRYAADQAGSDQALLPTLVFSINTAAYNTTTGAVTFVNGAMNLSAVAYGHQGSAAGSSSASQSLSYLLGNVDGFQTSLANGGNAAIDANGFAWWGNGTLTIKAIPVMYSGKTVGTVTASLAGVCGAVGGTGTSGSTTTAPYAVTLALTGSQSPAGCAGATPNVPVISATDNNGNVLTLVANGTINAQTGVRWDNVAPAAPVGSTFAGVSPNIRINVNPNGRFGGWINDAVTFNSTSTTKATTNGWLCVNPAAPVGACLVTDTLPRDSGVGGTTYYVSVGATKAAAYAAAPITSSVTLAATTTNAGYCAIAGAADALGNKTTLTAAQQATACGAEANSATFGVDRVAPVVGYGGAAIAANARISTATIGGEEIVTFADTGLVGNSGMNPATPVIASLVLRNVTATGAATCIVGTFASSVCGQSATGMTTTVGTGSSTTGVTGTSVVGYYTFNATATDAAGNSASVSPRVFVFDNTAPVVGAANTPVSVSAVGFAASAFVSEDLDIQSFTWGVNYGTFPFAPLQFAQGSVTQVNGYNANPFINANYVASSSVTLPLAFQAAAAATLYPLTTVQAIVLNQGNLSAAGAAAGPTTVTPGTALSTVGFTSYPADFLPAGITGLSSGVTTAATAAAPLASTLSATAVGLTATFNNPFTRVDFYAVNVAGTQWILIGSVATPSLVDIGGNRTFTWALPVNGAALYTQLGFSATATVNVIGVGMGASNTAIGMIPAATFGLNIIK